MNNCKHLKNTFHIGNFPCEKCRVEKLEENYQIALNRIKELEQDMESMHEAQEGESI